MTDPIIIPAGLTLANSLTQAAERTFDRASDLLGHIGDTRALRAGVRVAALAKRLEALAAEADKLDL